MTNLSVTALGAVTSVGYDATTAAASIRAGLTRPSVLDEFEVLDVAAQEPVGLTAHPLGEATHGFSGIGRWLQMASMALRDLCAGGAIPGAADAAFWASTLCYVVVPVLDPRRFDPTGPSGSEEALANSFIAPLAARCSRFFAPANTALLPHGRVGVIDALQMAARHIDEARIARAVVLAVDSLVDETALLWLAELNRLKEDDNPAGLVPGEAAVAFLVEGTNAARDRGARCVARIAAAASARDPQPFMARERSTGQALTEVIQRALAQSGLSVPYCADVVTDLNGETWRSAEYGQVRVKIPATVWDGDRLIMPASSVGDVGAAMTALEVLVAVHSLERGYAAAPHVMLISTDEYGGVGAAVLTQEG